MSDNSKLAINTKTGMQRMLPERVWKNPIRMKSGNWQLIENVADMPTKEAVSFNIPDKKPAIPPPGNNGRGIIPDALKDYFNQSTEPADVQPLITSQEPALPPLPEQEAELPSFDEPQPQVKKRGRPAKS